MKSAKKKKKITWKELFIKVTVLLSPKLKSFMVKEVNSAELIQYAIKFTPANIFIP